MEPIIIETTPQGSAILAYGSVRNPRSRFAAALAIIAGAFVVTAAVFAFALRTVPLPAHRLLTIAAVPARLNAALPADVVSDLPAPWRDAIRSKRRTPALFILAVEDGHIRAYAAVVGSHDMTSLIVAKNGPVWLAAEGTAHTTTTTSASMGSLLPMIFDLNHAAASWTIGGPELREFAGISPNASGTKTDDIRGRWLGNHGELDLKPDGNPESPKPSDTLFVFGNGSEDGAMKDALLARGIDVRAVQSPIASVGMSESPFTLRARFADSMSERDRRLAQAVFGASGLRSYTLGDSSEAFEIAATTTLQNPGTSFELNSSTTNIGPVSDAASHSVCSGASENFRLEGDLAKNTFKQIGLPYSILDAIHSVSIREKNGKTIFCLN